MERLNRLTDIIDDVAESTHTCWGKSKPATALVCPCDRIPIEYNRMWGIFSGTHMDIMDDGYIITGSFMRNTEMWSNFRAAKWWRGVNFKCSFNEFLEANSLEGKLTTINGDLAFKVTNKAVPVPEPECDGDCGEPCEIPTDEPSAI